MAIYDPDTIHDLCDKALKVQEHAMERKVNQSISKVIKGENPPKYNLRSIDSWIFGTPVIEMEMVSGGGK